MDINTNTISVFQKAAAITAKSLFEESLNDVKNMPNGHLIVDRIDNYMQFVRDNIGNVDNGIVTTFEAISNGDGSGNDNCIFMPL